ncbi:MAG: Spo0B domain-containing protein, partial [Pyramidobacter sp.]|nr:Spo0B domain-containing protein [Pyramidobacter sp.]
SGIELFDYQPVKNLDPMNSRMASDLALMAHTLPGKEKVAMCFALPFADQMSSLFLRSEDDYSFNDLRQKKILVVADSPEEMYLRHMGFSRGLIRCGSVEEAFSLLLRNIGDGVIAETYQGKYLIENRSAYEYKIKPVDMPIQTYQTGLVVLRGDSSLALKLAQGLRELKLNGTYSAAADTWLKRYDRYFPDPVLVLQIAASVGVFILLILGWNRFLKRKIRIVVGEREKIFDFVCDGILAVDQGGAVTMMNRMAKRLLGLDDACLGRSADTLVPGLDIQTVLQDGRPVYNIEQNLRGALVSCNKVPVYIDGAPFGAIVTLRDMSELQAMAEEITGVKMYVESLRIHNHEFMNKLQAISGLIQLKQYDRAVEFIAEETHSSQSAQSFMSERIKIAAVCGILMGKAGLCREQGISFALAADSYCRDHSASISDRSLVIIVGNLMQNAIEAICEAGVTADSRIDFAIYDESGRIFLSVRDSAGLMTDTVAANLFVKGFTTKRRGRPSGFGLFTIHNIVESLGGDIAVDYVTGEYTDFTVTIPIPCKED